MVPQLFELHRKGLSPVRMLIHRAGQINLLFHGQKILHGEDNKAGWSIGQVFCNSCEVGRRDAATRQCLAYGIQCALTIRVRFTRIDVKRPLDRQVAVAPPTRECGHIMSCNRNQRILAVALQHRRTPPCVRSNSMT